MHTITIPFNGRNLLAFESRRPRGYKVSHGVIGGDNDSILTDLVTTITSMGYTVIKFEMQSSAHGPIPTVYFK